MTKRRLTRRQLSRIKNRQQASALRAERTSPAPEEESLLAGLGPERTGLVISHFGVQLEIEALEGEGKGRTFRCHQRANLDPLVAGDRVIWRHGEPFGVVVAGLPRQTVLERPGAGGPRPIAANIDTLLIVIAPLPQPFPNLIDRYLVAGESMGARPLIVLNKGDLIGEEERPSLKDMLAVYEKIGYTVLETSAKKGTGIPALRAALRDHTSIFVGQSGAGKSALVNALLPGVNTLEGDLSEAADKGRHTTTAARLFHLPGGGDLIDSPGIREFGLGHMAPEDLIRGFIEFRPYLGHCRFRDCRHEPEPGCRLRQAVEEGDIDPRRLESYRRILDVPSA